MMEQRSILKDYRRRDAKPLNLLNFLPLIIFAALFSGGFALAFIVPSIRAIYISSQLGDAVETQAVITDTWSLFETRSGQYGIAYRFDAPLSDGAQATFTNQEQITTQLDESPPRPGDTMTILYNPLNPNFSMTKQHVEQHLLLDWTSLLCSTGVLLMAGILILFWWLNSRYNLMRIMRERGANVPTV
jgi:hypothetical protein